MEGFNWISRYPPSSAKGRRVNHHCVGRWEHHCWNEPNWDEQKLWRKNPEIAVFQFSLLGVDHPFKRLHDTSIYQMIESHSPCFPTNHENFLGAMTSNQGSHIQRLEFLTSPCCAVRNYWCNKSSSASLRIAVTLRINRRNSFRKVKSILLTSKLSEEMHC